MRLLSEILGGLPALIKPAFWLAFWFAIFMGPLWYLLPMVGWNAWWSILLGTAGAGVYAIIAGGLFWYAQQENAA